jgi:hypothetical protein
MSIDDKLFEILDTTDEPEDLSLAIEAVKGYLAKGANPNATDKFGFTPVQRYAAHWQDVSELIRLLASHGADVSARYDADRGFIKGETALGFACGGRGDSSSGHPNHVQTLLDLGITLELPEERYSAMHIAASNGLYEHVDILLRNGVDGTLRIRLSAPIDMAIEQGHLPVVVVILKAGVDINTEEALRWADHSDYDCTEIKRLLHNPELAADMKVPVEFQREWLSEEQLEQRRAEVAALRTAEAAEQAQSDAPTVVETGEETSPQAGLFGLVGIIVTLINGGIALSVSLDERGALLSIGYGMLMGFIWPFVITVLLAGGRKLMVPEKQPDDKIIAIGYLLGSALVFIYLLI